jgi:hypothetical protein
MARQTTPPEQRFWAKVTKGAGCWTWSAGEISTGYGAFHPAKNETVLAHRYAYELAIGPIPPGLVVDHTCHGRDKTCRGGPTCRHRRCVNPAHLEAVTNEENLRRGAGYALLNGMRTSCINGHPYTLENTYEAPDGGVRCRTCARERDRDRYRPRLASPRTPGEIDDEQVRDMYAAGWGATRIRAELHVSIDRLYGAMDRLGLPRRPSGRVKKAAA